MSISIEIKPLGGVAQIGSNMTLINYRNHEIEQNILIDCGILFPYEDVFDLNYLIADFTMLEDIIPDAIIFTHGHEDHIGAVSHLIEAYPKIEMYATKFTIGLIDEKLSRLNLRKKIRPLEFNRSLNFDKLEITPVHVNHSIPDTAGLIIHSKELDFSAFYCSDFKVDLEDFYEPAFNLKALEKKFSSSSRRLALLDSTNITAQQTKTLSEKELVPGLKKIVESSPSRCFITSFASNIHRIQTVFNIAKDLGKKVVLYGNAMNKYTQIAQATDHLDTYRLERDVDQIRPSDENLIILVSGCQGDFRSAVRRIAMNEDSRFRLKAGDRFIFSSKSIPGNEKKIGMLANSIVELGADVFFSGDHKIHASGHAGKEDLKLVYDHLKPTHAFPIHGESLFLKEHRRFIQENYPEAETSTFYNGDSILVTTSSIELTPNDPKEPILIHGKGLPLERSKISERRKIAQNGTFILSVLIEKKKVQFQSQTVGLPDEHTPENKTILSTIQSCLDVKDPAEEIRIRLRRIFSENLGYKPITYVFIHRK